MQWVIAGRMRKLAELRVLYESVSDPAATASRQLERFNAQWRRAWTTVPFYQNWRRVHQLPERIGCLTDLAKFPILTKQMISDERDLVATSPGVERFTLTGGTSGVSTPFPMSSNDADASWINTHIGRSWNGLQPGDRLLMIWGHSHLFSGKGAAIKQAKRRIKDRLNNITRVSAYNLDDNRLEYIAGEIRRFKPRYVIGYGSCLARLCGYLAAKKRNLRDARVVRVVNTSETLDATDADMVSNLFDCPVINEYGMAEAGVIGYSSGELYPVRVLWNDYIVRTDNRRLIVTTIGSRCFPLINYDTEDLCGDELPETGSHLLLDSLLGKARDTFKIVDAHGRQHEVSVVLFDHILKQIDPLRSLHYELESDGGVHVSYTSEEGQLSDELLKERFMAGLLQEGIEFDPAKLSYTWLAKPLQTTAGKRKALARQD